MREVFAVNGGLVLIAEGGKTKLGSGELCLGKVDLRILAGVDAILHDGDEVFGEFGLVANDLLALLVVIESDEGEGGVLGDSFADVLKRKLGGVDAGGVGEGHEADRVFVLFHVQLLEAV